MSLSDQSSFKAKTVCSDVSIIIFTFYQSAFRSFTTIKVRTQIYFHGWNILMFENTSNNT